MPLSTNLRTKILNAIVGKDSAFGGSIYLGLSKTAPNADGSGIIEPSSDSGYKRVLIGYYGQSYTQKFSVNSEGYATNKEDIYFPESTGAWSSSAQPITHFFLTTNETSTSSGNVIAFDILQDNGNPAPVVVDSAKTVVMFRKGAIAIRFSDVSLVDLLDGLVGE